VDFASRWEVLLKWFSIIRCAAAGKGSGFFGRVVPPTSLFTVSRTAKT